MFGGEKWVEDVMLYVGWNVGGVVVYYEYIGVFILVGGNFDMVFVCDLDGM